MRDKVIEIIKTMRGQSAIDDALGEKRCSFYLNDYANQLAAVVGYTEDKQIGNGSTKRNEEVCNDSWRAVD